MKAIYIVSGFFIVPGGIGMAFATLATIGKLNDSSASLAEKAGHVIGVSVLPMLLLSLGMLILGAGISANRQSKSGQESKDQRSH